MPTCPPERRCFSIGFGLWGTIAFNAIFGAAIGVAQSGDPRRSIVFGIAIGALFVVVKVVNRIAIRWQGTMLPGMVLGITDWIAVSLIVTILDSFEIAPIWPTRAATGIAVCLATGLPFWVLFERGRHN